MVDKSFVTEKEMVVENGRNMLAGYMRVIFS